VFSPYYHWSGRRRPEDHVAFNIALYTPSGAYWCMTERGRDSLRRDGATIRIGRSGMQTTADTLAIDFDETALPWPGQRLLPRRIAGRITLVADRVSARRFDLDPGGRHVWSPRMPRATARIECDALPGGGWQGRGYHDMNFGSRPVEKDFLGWDWARGDDGPSGETVILYDALLRDGRRLRLGLRSADDFSDFDPPDRQALPRGFWGVRSGVACDAGRQPRRIARLEDSPFYTRSRVETVLDGARLDLVHETLDCRRLANPMVRMMLPFRMPRRA
jgi:carotenoid 1,2-hydratase